MISVPQRLIGIPGVDLIYEDGQSWFLRKTLQEATLERQSYIAQLAISLVQSGRQEIIPQQGSKWVVKGGELLLLPRDIYTISDLMPESGKFETYLFFLDDQIIDRFLRVQNRPSLPANTFPERSLIKQNKSLEMFIHSLLLLHQEMEIRPAFFQHKLIELLHLISEALGADHFVTLLHFLQKSKRKDLKAFMENNFDKALTVEDYASLTGRSLSTFRRDFKRYYQQTPQQWLKNKRLEKAALLMQEKDLSIQLIAQEV
ncbi:MAG: AraC family transcriptional regulator, partial [Bacteroidota bacterium]